MRARGLRPVRGPVRRRGAAVVVADGDELQVVEGVAKSGSMLGVGRVPGLGPGHLQKTGSAVAATPALMPARSSACLSSVASAGLLAADAVELTLTSIERESTRALAVPVAVRC